MEIEISDWQLIREIEHRIEAKSIFRAKNGKLWPKVCPRCGGSIFEYGIDINLTKEQMDVMDFEQWRQFSRKELDKMGLYLPDLPYKQSGMFFYVRCENSYSDFAPMCRVVNYEWFRDLDDARNDFFNSATE